jgi:hypothetical protein
MPYTTLATAQTPALIVYLLDVSASMNQPLGTKRRVDVVMEALGAVLRQMVFRSTKGSRIAPRYRVAMLAYSDQVFDLLDGVKPVDVVAQRGVPQLPTMRTTDTARAFAQVAALLQAELPGMQHCPAPLVCHMTDGEYTGADPEPLARQITALQVADGNVLLENIFISDKVVAPITDALGWPGITPATPLQSPYAEKLRAISSPLPAGYRDMLLESGYGLAADALMLLPGGSSSLVELGFAMSGATPVTTRP